MTTFNAPLKVGRATTSTSTDTRGTVVAVKEVDLTAASASATIKLPSDAGIVSVIVAVTTAVTGAAGGGTVTVGVSGTANKYASGSIGTSTGLYTLTLTKDVLAAGGNVVVAVSPTTGGQTISAVTAKVAISYIARAE